jgi:hypothetical protein
VARLGLGTTLTKNQTDETNPNNKNTSIDLFSCFSRFFILVKIEFITHFLSLAVFAMANTIFGCSDAINRVATF